MNAEISQKYVEMIVDMIKNNSLDVVFDSIDDAKNSSLTRILRNIMTKKDAQKIIDHIEASLSRLDSLDKDEILKEYRLSLIEAKVADHEARIARLESQKQTQ